MIDSQESWSAPALGKITFEQGSGYFWFIYGQLNGMMTKSVQGRSKE